MSISAVNGVSSASQPPDRATVADPVPAVTPFSQQLDSQTAEAAGAHGHHHHHGGAGQSVTSSAASAASAAGVSPAGSVASSVLNLLA